MRKYLLAIMMSGTLASPALAQSTEGSPFTGFRVEGLAGYDVLRPGGGDEGSDGEADSIDGLLYGVGVGFDFDLGGVVAGIEGEFSKSTGKQNARDAVEGIDVASSFEVGRDLYIGGRIGFTAGSSTLIYAKGGYTNARVDASVEFDGAGFGESGLAGFETKARVDGFRLGAGIEQLFGPNVYGKLEYRYSNYSSFEVGDDSAGTGNEKIDLDRHQVVVGLGFRF